MSDSKELFPQSLHSWPVDGLEYLGRCPVCGALGRQKLYENLWDRLYRAPGLWTLYCCEGCGSGYLDPRPNAETIALAYENYGTHENEPSAELTNEGLGKRLRVAIRNGYLNRKYGYRFEPAVSWGYLAMHLMPPPLRLEWDHYARHLPRPTAGRNRLLDVGCGNGAFLARARRAGWEVQGLEFDPQAAALARLQGVDVWVGDYRHAPFDMESFDVVTAHQVIEHVHDLRSFVGRLASWLKPSGRLWIGTPNFNSMSRRYFRADWRSLHPPQHLVLLSPDALRSLLAEFGLNVSLYRRGFFESHVFSESCALREGATDIMEISRRKDADSNRLLGVLMDVGSWLFPKLGCDLVALGVKKEKTNRISA